MNKNTETLVFALGGLGEVGKNMYVIEHQDELVIVDAGTMFPSDDLFGIDYVLPDFNYLKENQHKIKGIFITHGHEDHIGAIPFLIKELEIPAIYVPNMAGKLIENKIKDRNLPMPNLIYYDEEAVYTFKHFMITFFINTHSIPDSYGVCIKTPEGTIVVTGDFKFDLTPVGPISNLHKMAAIGSAGVTLLLSDSTNAMVSGFSISESEVDETLQGLVAEAKGRIIVATFASNMYRLKHVVETCREQGRKIAIFGRSMVNNIGIGTETGYIKDDGIFITTEEASKMKPHEVCLLCTGSQGEEFAALTRIAKGTFKQFRLAPEDTVVFSSSPVPGNATSISKTINQLYLKGVKVFTTATTDNIHASGHANVEECKLMLRLIKPKYFMPVHGEFRMLQAHAKLAIKCGIPKENNFVLGNGEILSIKDNNVTLKQDKIKTNNIYVDGNRIGDTHNAVMRDRKIMTNDGVVILIADISLKNKKIISKVNITPRGFILISENIPLIKALEKTATRIINDYLGKIDNIYDLRSNVTSELSKYIKQKMDRTPLIMPIINDLDNKTKQSDSRPKPKQSNAPKAKNNNQNNTKKEAITK